VSRTGTTFTAGLEEGFTAFVKRAQDSFALGVQLADAASRAMGQGFEKLFFDVVEGRIRTLQDLWRGLGQAFTEFANQVIHELARIAAQQLASSFLGGIGGIGGFFGSLFGGLFGGGSTAGASVGALDLIGGSALAFAHEGGMIAPRRFAIGGPVFGSGNRDTVPALLSPGEYVLTKSGVDALDRLNKGDPSGLRPGGISVTVTTPPPIINVMNEHPSAEVQAQQSRGPDGTDVIEFFITKVKEGFARGSFDGTMSTIYGLQRRGAVR
jgi:hypothetical protein